MPVWLSIQSFTFSYKQRIHSELAEVLMSGHSGSITKEQPLPDLVRCTSQLSYHTASYESTLQQRWTHSSRSSKVVPKKMTKQTAAKTLREFMKYNLSLLDKESRYDCVKSISLSAQT